MEGNFRTWFWSETLVKGNKLGRRTSVIGSNKYGYVNHSLSIVKALQNFLEFSSGTSLYLNGLRKHNVVSSSEKLIHV